MYKFAFISVSHCLFFFSNPNYSFYKREKLNTNNDNDVDNQSLILVCIPLLILFV